MCIFCPLLKTNPKFRETVHRSEYILCIQWTWVWPLDIKSSTLCITELVIQSWWKMLNIFQFKCLKYFNCLRAEAIVQCIGHLLCTQLSWVQSLGPIWCPGLHQILSLRAVSGLSPEHHRVWLKKVFKIPKYYLSNIWWYLSFLYYMCHGDRYS